MKQRSIVNSDSANFVKFLTVSGAKSGSKLNSIFPKFVSIKAFVNNTVKIIYHKNLLSNIKYFFIENFRKIIYYLYDPKLVFFRKF